MCEKSEIKNNAIYFKTFSSSWNAFEILIILIEALISDNFVCNFVAIFVCIYDKNHSNDSKIK